MTPEELKAHLREVIDPELGVNVVDLGLIYRVEINAADDVLVDMTTTTPACPLGSYLQEQVRERVRQALPTAGTVRVRLVSQPTWRPEMMSEDARRQLGWDR